MLQNKIVVRYQDGRILKEHTGDLLPTKSLFHLTPCDSVLFLSPPQAGAALEKFREILCLLG